jgi:hypothetical protein
MSIYTWERGAGLGWFFAASFSIICPELHHYIELYQLLCNGQNFRSVGNWHVHLNHPLEVCINVRGCFGKTNSEYSVQSDC